MPDICLCFEVHQPYRLNKDFYWNKTRLKKDIDLFNLYFDEVTDKKILDRVANKCYFPTNNLILKAIDFFKSEKGRIRIALSLSGVFIEQCEKYNPDLLDSFQKLADTKCVEFLNQTYYHSLASLYEDKDEFIEQVEMHRSLIKDLFKIEPVVFENTELIYNNRIAKIAEELGFKGIYTEGIERILNGRSPNYIYRAFNSEIKVLLRNYRLTDDFGFRFSAKWWEEYPLTAEKYATWLESTPGQIINLFADYETFGEHHWPETGIHDFLWHLFLEVNKRPSLTFITPGEAIEKHQAAGEIDVYEKIDTVSWADLERDTSCWLGNQMQHACYKGIKDLGNLIKETENEEFKRIWRLLQTSDHFYYMFTAGGAPGEVHSYFSHFNTPMDAFLTYFSILCDFENRVKEGIKIVDPFYFFIRDGEFTGKVAFSLKGFKKIIEKIDISSIEYHMKRGDIENWMSHSIKNQELANKIANLKEMEGERLRKALINLISQII
ncbi:MAG: alpha-amylase [Candidatus Hydrothermarchaeota archaeon]